MVTKFLKDIFREMEASVQKCRAFINISIIFKYFFREIEAAPVTNVIPELFSENRDTHPI
jgi:hypothetical protein